MLIYLASPYTPTEEQIAKHRAAAPGSADEVAASIKRARFDAVCRATAALMRAGVHVISPIAASHPVALAGELPGDFAFWQALDRELIDACAEVWVLAIDGWDTSVGIADEVEYALEHGKAVHYVDPDDVTAPLRSGGAL